MRKARGWMVRTMGKVGRSGFRLLSGLEERIHPTPVPIIGWLKLGLLGILVTLISSCSRKPEAVVSCYEPVLAAPVISNVSISPNPTGGADSVKIKATAKVFRPGLEGNRITGASVNLGEKTNIPLKPVDGKFSDTIEVLEGYLNVEELEPGTTWVYLNVSSSNDAPGTSQHQLIVTNDVAEEE